MAEYYQVTQAMDQAYRFSSLENVFFELLVGKETALLIDTGYGFGDVKGAVRRITDKPLTVMNTHGHVDHTSGNFQFEEDIYIAEKDLDLLRRHNTRAFRLQSAKLQEHARDWETGREQYGLPDHFDCNSYVDGAARYPSDKPSGENGQYHFLKEGMVFDLGGLHVRVMETPGHTKGSVSFYWEEQRVLYVGDAANPFLWLFDGDAADRDTLVRSYDRILDLAPERIYGGHAPMPFTVEDVRQFRRAAIEADYEKGVPFSTPLMPECRDIRVCILDNMTMEDIGKPGFYSILIDRSRA